MAVSKIIWQTPKGFVTDFDLEFLKCVLFKDIGIDLLFDDAKLLARCNESLIVYSCNQRNVPEEFEQYVSSLKNYSLCHLSNESLNHNSSYYTGAEVVLRSYFDPLIKSKNVFFIPLGFKTGFYNKTGEIPGLNSRNFLWAFAGQLKNHRKEMLEVMKRITPHFVHLTSKWNSDDQLSVSEVAEIYKKTIFVPCPFGSVNPDSFRIMEALEWGCIPVVVKYKGIDYYKFIFGDHPFIIGDTWEAAAAQMEALLANRGQLEQKVDQLNSWYMHFKTNLSFDVRQILNGRPEALRSKQFYYQKKQRRNIYLEYIFWKDFYFRKTSVSRLYRRIENRFRHIFTSKQVGTIY